MGRYLGGGLDLFDEDNDRFLHYRDGDLNSVNSNFILTMEEDSDGDLWVGTSYGVNVLHKRTGRFSHIPANPGKQNALSHHIVLAILEDQRGFMWFGTRNGLNMYNPETKEFRLFLERDGLPDNNILNLLEDSQGNIWMSTLNGLSRLKIRTGNEGPEYSFNNFDLLDGLQGREFNEHASFKTSNGELIFGGPDGFNLFDPSKIQRSTRIPQVRITGLRLFNKQVEVGEKVDRRVILQRPLFLSDTLELRHDQNVISLDFSGMGYFHPEKIKYQYFLEGFNQEWVAADAQNPMATYTNLNYGTYRFRVRGQVGDDATYGGEAVLTVIIKPPFYATRYAYGAYILLFAGLVVFFGFIVRRRERIKYQRQNELMEHKRIHELDEMKIRFFTNISHEFRTPLTLILTPLEKLIGDVKDAGIREQLKLVTRNARRLLGLVNQLLDFRKIEVQGIVLSRTKGDIVAFVREVAISFSDLFDTKSIRFSISSNVDSLTMSFDPDKMEKIVFNLLSNAFKFSQENGEVKLNIEFSETSEKNSGGVVRIAISDTGIGIPSEKQEKIFERFFQVGNRNTQNLGSGIGLAITQEFVRLHEGEIFLTSEPGQGSTFTVELPLTHEEDTGVASDERIEVYNLRGRGKKIADKQEEDHSEKPLLLIIEDNEDLRFYLKENLRRDYRIVEAADGDSGLEKARSVYPDIIISDIMMPGTDGVKLCRILKSESKTSHIPVILLTAKVSSEQEAEGLGAGADDYITKPFNYEVLELKIRKQIEIRRQFRAKLEKQHFEIEPGEIGVTSLDEKFIKKATRFVEKNIANTDLSVEIFSREMGVSRGHLYNKIVSLTGKTPTEFIRIMRLKRGAQLLGKSQLNVGEVAFKVGFNDPKYFSRYFKEEFGVSPSEYVKRIEKNG
ncbi:ATP-binding protein [Marinilabilia salmonicolor]|uniref:ATP-binding protein n=1 Tax=Marinilabilia salmonicolor TaxID=989 RepID=UPI001F36D56E|nr:ATP-binding protein [Marinilabilia salmonicolor]